MTSLHNPGFSIQPEVEQALQAGRPVVALESTVITHGLPYPENLELAKNMEATIRGKGCIPATIAILEGMVQIGLQRTQLDHLAQLKNIHKISQRDIASALTHKQTGGTTVAGTLAIADRVGLKVFATGGIGGVHRLAPFDISADLGELARAKLVVVCAGAKAILDIPATLEVLETNGVPVVGYQTDEFPAFYSRSSGRVVSARVDTAEQVAELAHMHWKLGLGGCILVAVAPPVEVAVDSDTIESAIQRALREVQERNIYGQAVTPYLLQRVSEITVGKSLRANLGLLLNNARIAAEIAQVI